ncbi:nuclear transport factor 2 family protein [Cognatiyoonia sp. IB215446]|uniref:nuclear transport factor 2 family protein n=1 Tax=Cognatiyoonia sp. IB215446 TaxID=3097355 RepID=UPI002A0DCABE|nr:nuclear transport factor 2 family protein [Cognatiyoonia sp. IB215446]MDX8350103.1 nuclear transport factor 2 family protein [Cognatiyoonia sp. IB215446]
MDTKQNKLLLELKASETDVWQALVRGDVLADEKALHTDFLGVYPDGFATKADHVQQLDDGPTVKTFVLSDCRAVPLGQDFAIFSYKVAFQRTGACVTEEMFVSSVWQRSGSGWINIFSQDTPAK